MHIDIVDTIAEIGDQTKVLARLRQNAGVDPVGDGRHQHIGGFDGFNQIGLGKGRVGDIKLRIEQFAHPRFDDIR